MNMYSHAHIWQSSCEIPSTLHIRNLQENILFTKEERRETKEIYWKIRNFNFIREIKEVFFFFCKVSRSSGKYKRIYLNIEYRKEKNKTAEVWIHSMFRSLAQGARISKVVTVDQFCNISWKSREFNVNVYICQYLLKRRDSL